MDVVQLHSQVSPYINSRLRRATNKELGKSKNVKFFETPAISYATATKHSSVAYLPVKFTGISNVAHSFIIFCVTFFLKNEQTKNS